MKRANDFLASYVHTSLSKFFLEKVLDTEWHSVPRTKSRGGDPARQESGPLLPDTTRYSKLTGRLPIITAADTRQNFTSTTAVYRSANAFQFNDFLNGLAASEPSRGPTTTLGPVNGHFGGLPRIVPLSLSLSASAFIRNFILISGRCLCPSTLPRRIQVYEIPLRAHDRWFRRSLSARGYVIPLLFTHT